MKCQSYQNPNLYDAFARRGHHEKRKISPTQKSQKVFLEARASLLCNDPNCNFIAHSCFRVESRMNRLPLLKGLSCFELSHDKNCKDAFFEIERKHTRSLRKCPTHEEISNLQCDLKQIEDFPMPVSRRGRIGSEQDIANTTLPSVHKAPLDKIDVSTA